MKFEFSAGGIVYKEQKTKIKKQKFILVCKHSGHHGWVFPKGLIGDHIKGEKKEETALREVEEETGVKANIIEEVKPTSYWYNWGGEKIKKTVYYFVMEASGGDITKHDDEMEAVEWIPFDEVAERLTYDSDKNSWQKTRDIILKL
jgi:8-oxo-dGTP pyrophosphatase MutT (NUDIX family)